ncbi:hypothetical protein B566_EDAN006722 [Ephemera danica]|nr:hypothetical protein B566_EDAN006722 [Ephemera danica]
MGNIIQRDFFPDLEKLKAQNEYLDAVEKNDIQKLRELYAKYSSGARPPTERYASPATFETPLDTRGDETPILDTPRIGAASDAPNLEFGDSASSSGKQLSLDQYLGSHTSEDNQSFQDIMHEAELKHRQKFARLYDAEEKHHAERQNQLALPSIEQQACLPERPLDVDNWEYKNKNYIMYIPDGVDLTQKEKVEAARSRQEVVHDNTRLVHCPFDERQSKAQIAEMAQNQARSQDGRIGVDGLVQTSGETGPTVRGFGFVKTPSPAPGVCESPLMTWGEIEGTPFRLDGSDTPVRPSTGPSFRMAQPPKREKLALALAEKAGQRHRDLKQKAIEAARKQLATALRASYSPSPLLTRTPSSTAGTPLLGRRHGTPLVRTPSRLSAEANTITDDLLNIPKRPRAADFF